MTIFPLLNPINDVNVTLARIFEPFLVISGVKFSTANNLFNQYIFKERHVVYIQIRSLIPEWLCYCTPPFDYIHWSARKHLTHWGRVTHICVSKLNIIVPDNGLSPDRRQAIIWINVGRLLIQTSGTTFSEILNEIHKFSFKKMHLKMSSAKWRPFCLGLNVLIPIWIKVQPGWLIVCNQQAGLSVKF